MYRALIVEDEFHSRKRLRTLLDKISEVECLDEAENGFRGLELYGELKPDLVFLDIQMPGLSGFEFLQQLNPVPMIIFTTAYDQYALQAFDTLAVDYLLKPVTLEQLRKTIEKLRFMESASQKLGPLLNPRDHVGHPLAQYLRRFSVRHGTRWSLIREEEVVRFFASDSLSYVVTLDGRDHIIDYSLQELELKLDPIRFIRVHRSTIVSIPEVKKIQSLGSSRFQICQSDGHEIESSRTYCERIRATFLDK